MTYSMPTTEIPSKAAALFAHLADNSGEAESDLMTKVAHVLVDLFNFLLEKNKAYTDNSLLNPPPHPGAPNITPLERAVVHMQDKIARTTNGRPDNEDSPKDYVGYWVIREAIARLRF